ncbi:hypothetical protein [Erythrobacter sp. 3-20A1M]|uniref:hypothetical protein n=1 Tax=Erythrobacter sp. 3-20A1M TaxID=2653850 RepID=UPI002041EDEA|nr:hypothetical protein [Erythrobacter sp. 3-20A1M]
MTDANPNPSERFADFGDGFHHLRGTFRVGGVLNVGTHCALVELPSGKFVFLDSYTLPDAVRPQVDQLTDGGSKVAAIINLHPFHTLHIEWMHRAFPNAALYGTRRHIEKFHILPWESELCEDGLPDEVTEGQSNFPPPAASTWCARRKTPILGPCSPIIPQAARSMSTTLFRGSTCRGPCRSCP